MALTLHNYQQRAVDFMAAHPRCKKRLEDAQIGEYFRFETSTGRIHFLECIGFITKTRYDYNAWCVSEQTYEETIPQFRTRDGKKVCFQGNADVITKEEYYKNNG